MPAEEGEHLGYVRRVPDPTDRRAKFITLTETGVRCIQAGLDTIAGIEEQLKALLGRRKLVALRSTLRQIMAAGAGISEGEIGAGEDGAAPPG